MGKLASLYFIILIGIFSCDSRNYEEINEIIAQVQMGYVPDNRTAIFDVQASKGNPVKIIGETNLPGAKEKLMSLLQSEGLKVVDAISIIPGEDIGEAKYALVNVSVANLREKPSHSAELVTQALLGTPVKLLKKQRGWYLMQTPDKYIAWSNASSIWTINKTQLESWQKSPKIIFTDTYGFSTDPEKGNRVSDLVAGSILTLKNENSETWEVTYPDGRIALINKSEAANLNTWKDTRVLDSSSLSSTAVELMGIPYLWGGTSSKGLDCSGFTKTVYFLHGMVLPRDASQQVLVGNLVDTTRNFSALEVGDLLFFGSKSDDLSERVVHVGLWLGDMNFIHASGDVHISSMDSLDENFDRYNFDRYLRSKRVTGNAAELASVMSELYQAQDN